MKTLLLYAIHRISFLRTSEKLALWRMKPGEREFLRMSTSVLRRLGICGAGRGGKYDPRAALEGARSDGSWLEGSGRFFVPIWSPAYPHVLRNVYDPPFALYVRYTGGGGSGGGEHSGEPAPAGSAELPRELFNGRLCFAVVGTRKPSGVGVSCARRVSRELSERGIVLVSGLARGIDSAAHRGAIDTGGCTIAVLGHGCDYIYPHAHFNLACEMLQNGGALVSEYPPGTRPAPFRFPERNRIISGMSEGLMLVEAPEKSGALITVDFALEQGRDVFVMPDTLNSRRNEGGRQLYEHGAPAMDNAVEILRYLRGDYA